FFVHVDPQAGLIGDGDIAGGVFGRGGKNFEYSFAPAGCVFLNAEVGNGEADVAIGHVGDGGDVSGSMPGGEDAVGFAKCRDFLAGRNAADVCQVVTHVVDEVLRD